MRTEKEIRIAKKLLEKTIVFMNENKIEPEELACAKGSLLAFEWILEDYKKDGDGK